MSGIMLLPIVVGLIVSLILSGFLTSTVGYSNPFMILTGVLTPIAAGLLTTLTVNTKFWKVIIVKVDVTVSSGTLLRTVARLESKGSRIYSCWKVSRKF